MVRWMEWCYQTELLREEMMEYQSLGKSSCCTYANAQTSCVEHMFPFWFFSIVVEKKICPQWLRNENSLTGLQYKYLDDSRLLCLNIQKQNTVEEKKSGKLSVICINTQVCPSCLLVYAHLCFGLHWIGVHNAHFLWAFPGWYYQSVISCLSWWVEIISKAQWYLRWR